MESSPKVFISYSHDSDEHRERVLALSERLRKDGIETRLDQYLNGAPIEGWPRWMRKQLNETDYAILVCTEPYHRRFWGEEEPGKGKGVDWEATLITQEIYDARNATLKFIPVIFAEDHQAFIPEPLRSKLHYTLISEANYQALYDFLLGQAGVEPNAVGEPKRKPRAKGQPLTFDDDRDTNIHPSSFIPHPFIKLPPPLTPYLFGRDDELQLLDKAWANPSTNIVVFHALGGAGKSALVSKWLAQMAKRNYDGARHVFGWSFFSQGSSENRSDSSEAFIDSALAFFGVTVEGDYFRKADRLAEALRAERTVLVLDGVEPLQYPPNTAGLPEGGFKDRALQTILLQLAAQQPGLCIITSRERLNDLNGYDEATVIQRPLDHLPYETATGEQPCAQLLRALGVAGDDAEMLQAAREFKGHAYGLTLLGSYVAEVLGGDLRRRKDIANLFDDDRFGSKADRMIAAYETWLGAGAEVAILRLLGLLDRPAEAASIAALREAPALPGLTEALQGLSEVKWQQALAKLRRLNLLSPANPHVPGELDAHPLVREHFRQQLKTHAPEAWRAGNLRLYEHLTRTAKDLPDTLAEMQPLFAAVTHGCAAGLQQQVAEDVYWRRIRRGEKEFQTKILCAFGANLAALSGFFATPWNMPATLLTEKAQAFTLNEAGLALRALGRLREALLPMQTARDAAIERATRDAAIGQATWEDSAKVCGNISELTLTLGDLSLALAAAKQSVELADRSNVGSIRIFSRTTLADALHQTGSLTEAAAEFRAAEALQKEWQPEYSLLYHIQGFRYYDLLLSLGKWQEVQIRAAQTLEWFVSEYPPLAIALDQLALGRGHLGLAQQADCNAPDAPAQYLAQAADWLQRAVDGLRQAGQQQYLPLGLLARAAWARVAQQFDRAHSDLAEARSIAERGEMRLHLTDYHLESACLALAQGNKDTVREHWAQAQQLIAETGYHRRDGELAELAEQLREIG